MVFSEERSMPKAAPAVFDMTLKSFDVQAINLKRGFQVKQALGGLRTLGMLAREFDSPSQDDLTTTRLKPAKQPK
jgi:hypothetical protein